MASLDFEPEKKKKKPARRVNYGVSFVRILEKNYLAIMRFEINTHYRRPIRASYEASDVSIFYSVTPQIQQK